MPTEILGDFAFYREPKQVAARKLADYVNGNKRIADREKPLGLQLALTKGASDSVARKISVKAALAQLVMLFEALNKLP